MCYLGGGAAEGGGTGTRHAILLLNDTLFGGAQYLGERVLLVMMIQVMAVCIIWERG